MYMRMGRASRFTQQCIASLGSWAETPRHSGLAKHSCITNPFVH